MKRVTASLLILFLFTVLTSCNNSVGETEPPPVWSGKNDNPITFVSDLVETDIENVYYTSTLLREGRFSFERPEQFSEFINNLRKLKLLDKVDNYDITGAEVHKSYEIQLKNKNPITLHFYDDVIDFGQGFYYYIDANDTIVSEEISSISVTVPEYESECTYNDSEDIKGLRSTLTLSPGSDATIQAPDDFSDLVQVYMTNFSTENMHLYIYEKDTEYFCFKNFFASYLFMGEISQASYDTLLQSGKAQFGTQAHFSITSGGKTIYPLGHAQFSTTFEEDTGREIAGCNFPRLHDWEDSLESVTYDSDFGWWIGANRTGPYVSIAATYSDDLTLEDIKALPPGEYTLECRLRTQGKYVEKANNYNSYSYCYWFKLIKK